MTDEGAVGFSDEITHRDDTSRSPSQTSERSDEGFLTQSSSESEIEMPRRRTRISKEENTSVTGDQSETNTLERFSRLTRSGNSVLKLMVKIKRMVDDVEEVDCESLKCIICCEKKKTTILFPCLHQHTCDACWALWSVECISRIKEISFNDSNETKPTCPYCKGPVDNVVNAIN